MANTLQHRGWISGIRTQAASVALALAVVMVLVATATPSAQAQTFSLLYSFKGQTQKDGDGPFAVLTRDAAGNLYGTTQGGGAGFGTVFKLDTLGQETVLYSFNGTGGDGQSPSGSLARDAAGNLYGTTGGGGASGFGTVFKLDTKGTETVLHSFAGGTTDGQSPSGGLIRDPAGNLYGTTYSGGASANCTGGCGTVFRVSRTGGERVLYSFKGGTADGANPSASLVWDTSGNLCGTTGGGGASGFGTVFQLAPTGTEKVLHSFTGGPTDGRLPEAGLVRDAAGNLYGTTFLGGSSTSCTSGCGTVFKVSATRRALVLYNFTGGTGTDGDGPIAGLVWDGTGNLYGAAHHGGVGGRGTIFKLTPAGTLTVLHSFTGGVTDGDGPYTGLIRDAAGNLYGATRSGGDFSFGTVFEVNP